MNLVIMSLALHMSAKIASALILPIQGRVRPRVVGSMHTARVMCGRSLSIKTTASSQEVQLLL